MQVIVTLELTPQRSQQSFLLHRFRVTSDPCSNANEVGSWEGRGTSILPNVML